MSARLRKKRSKRPVGTGADMCRDCGLRTADCGFEKTGRREMRCIQAMVVLMLVCSSFAVAEEPNEKPKVEQGREAVRGRPALNPPLWSLSAYENAWKVWGLK